MGRHREFCVEKALDAALCVFWRKGHEGTSCTDLTAATGVERRFVRAKAEGDLPEAADCATLAAYVMAVAHGVAAQAKAGFPRDVPQAVAAQALAGRAPRGRTPMGRES